MKEQTPLKILQINTSGCRGGAESVSWNLHNTYRRFGLDSRLAVGFKYDDSHHVIKIPSRNGIMAALKYFLTRLSGKEDFDHPGIWTLMRSWSFSPDIIHCHNLHDNYFDLRVLPYLSRQFPVILNLHDAWLLGGHCCHSFGCERWETGCGNCPGLDIYPPIARDATAYNWQRKQKIYNQSRFYITTPSKWLMDKVKRSMLKPTECKVINNGVDLDIFHPSEKYVARRQLNIPKDSKVILFAANCVKKNPFKDYSTMEKAVKRLLVKDKNIMFLCLGAEKAGERPGIRLVSFMEDPAEVVKYFQAADVYLHGAKAETFSMSILEALSCGTPVVATDIGGIPEIVQDGVTGFLVPPGEPEAMADKIKRLISDPALHGSMSERAAETSRRLYSLDRQAKDYIDWYREILGKNGASPVIS